MTDLDKNIIRNNDENEPVRLNKYLSDAGFCSRREADRLIEEGKVFINGVPALLGQKVLPGDKVTACGKDITLQSRMILLAFNKPEGIECTTDPKNPDNIIDFIGYPERVYPIGRLDKASCGLILLTNTGDLVNRILKSVNMHEKEYIVRIDRPVTDDFINKMSSGVMLKDVPVRGGFRDIKTRKCTVLKNTGPEGADNEFRIVLTQGINRQIRRMCSALGCRVLALKRIRIMNINLNDLPEGHYRDITENEALELISQLKDRQVQA